MRTARALLVAGRVCSVDGSLHWPRRRPGRIRATTRAPAEYDYAPVTHVEPIVRQVRVETPRRECYDDIRYVESRCTFRSEVGGRTLLGGIIGGVIGHQFGSGRGRDAATVAGAAIGAASATTAAARQYGSRDARGSRAALRRPLRATSTRSASTAIA